MKNKPRTGFTLIELMIVMVIIAILIGLLVRVVAGSMRKVRITGVKVEISQLEAAISKFKADHGVEPPSFITLRETGSDWLLTGAANDRALIRQIWPQFDFSLNRDFNGDGDSGAGNQTVQLSLGECLVLFLGGTPSITMVGGKPLFSTTGFSKNPANPFASGGSREASLFEFNSARLTDVNGNNFPEYKDALPGQTQPYLYYSSYDGQGYRESVEFGGGGLTAAYRQGPNATDPFWKASSYQIISPGYDRQYGFGGGYLATGSDRLPLPASPPPTAAQRATEADNITNFSEAELQP